MKKTLKKAIENFGVLLFKKSFLPTGISMKNDLAKQIRPESVEVVFDVGANVGNMSLMFNEAFPKATIYSFEPVTTTFDLLAKNAAHISRIKPYQLGFSSKPGKIRIYLQRDHGLNSVNDQVNLPDAEMNNAFEEADLRTVSDFCAENKIDHIDLLKTDTEGLDLEVLKGCENMLKQGKIDYILSEVGFYEDNERNTSFEDLRKYLGSFGYRLRGFYDQSTFGNVNYLTCANALFALQK